jgi:hypothetical protein
VADLGLEQLPQTPNLGQQIQLVRSWWVLGHGRWIGCGCVVGTGGDVDLHIRRHSDLEIRRTGWGRKGVATEVTHRTIAAIRPDVMYITSETHEFGVLSPRARPAGT